MNRTGATKIDTVHAWLRKEILAGRWEVGERLPTDQELAERFSCSAGTINKAMASIVHEGLVSRKTRAGTTVIRKSPQIVASPAMLDAYAFICPTDLHEGIRRAMHGFQDAARDARQRTLVLTTGLDLRKEAEIIGRLSEFDVKGVAIQPVLPGPEERLQFLKMVQACPLPVTLMQSQLPGLACSSVHIDGLHAGYVMTKHLLKGGLKRVGFVSNYAWDLVMREKFAGYRQAMFEAGLDEACEKYAHLQTEMHPDFHNPLREPRTIARAYLKAHPDVEGIVCTGDFLAFGMVEAALEAGFRVPEDLKITGMEGFRQPSAAPMPLTTYRYPYEAMGAKAFETLRHMSAKEENLLEECRIRGELIVQASAP